MDLHDAKAAEAPSIASPPDPVTATSPGVPPEEAHRLTLVGAEPEPEPEGRDSRRRDPSESSGSSRRNGVSVQKPAEGTLRRSHTNPLFPPLPLYRPPSPLRNLQCLLFRTSSFFLSLAFLAVIILGALFTSASGLAGKALRKAEPRPFAQEEEQREAVRRREQQSWERRGSAGRLGADREQTADEFPPTEGGRDPIVCDVGYYARRVGLDVETLEVQTEDGFVVELWHVFDPRDAARRDEGRSPDKEKEPHPGCARRKPKFPVLLMHGLLQSSGAYCCSDDESLAFWLCKSGFDVWLGNNRCGFRPRHADLEYGDPRMWSWNIRQMGVYDLTALTSRVLGETGFARLGLVCHSQGTTETFVALAKEQRPELGDRLTVFCALAPAAYAGPLIGKLYFRFMRVMSPAMFRVVFGVHAFIPFMMRMHALLPPRLYGWLGYQVFAFLFHWSDRRWDRGLRDRMFQFAPVYVSAESMRWWLGREGFAKHKCILATRETTRAEEAADDDDGDEAEASSDSDPAKQGPGATAWYGDGVPPFALWVCGSDDLVDGERLLRRFRSGREPHVRVVHSRVLAEYEHLDVIWAMDAVDQVFKEVREVLWKTCDARDAVRVPTGCEAVEPWRRPAGDGAPGARPAP